MLVMFVAADAVMLKHQAISIHDIGSRTVVPQLFDEYGCFDLEKLSDYVRTKGSCKTS